MAAAMVQVEGIAPVVAVGPALSEGGEGGHYELPVEGAKLLVVEPPLLHLPRRAVFDEDIHLLRQPPEYLPSRRCADIQGDAQLVSVDVEEEAALLRVGDIVGEGPSATGPVACWRFLYLYHLGP